MDRSMAEDEPRRFTRIAPKLLPRSDGSIPRTME
jgi:hypothetical protein